MISSSRFRRQVKIVLVKKVWQQWKSCCCFIHNQIGPDNAESLHERNVDLEEIN
jgi:hypothetical protein